MKRNSLLKKLGLGILLSGFLFGTQLLSLRTMTKLKKLRLTPQRQKLILLNQTV